jgi:RNA polymerase sigma-70 factor (ECF subfamily)
MFSADTLSALLKDDKAVQRQVFEALYPKLSGICSRYAKNQQQANEMLNVAFNNCLHKLHKRRNNLQLNVAEFFDRQFIIECVDFVKAIRSEYYVSSTVYATNTSDAKNYDLFEDNRYIDVNTANNEVLIKSLQQMVPSQRLIVNLHVIDGYSLTEAAQILEASDETTKSNLEKARFNLQKNIEKNIKSIKNEQPL